MANQFVETEQGFAFAYRKLIGLSMIYVKWFSDDFD